MDSQSRKPLIGIRDRAILGELQTALRRHGTAQPILLKEAERASELTPSLMEDAYAELEEEC